jgi:glucosamine--fructose-6-phosphate aminotransferase (isomerizing)
MCGIIGYVGTREAKPLLLSGLRRLEYRGYDSAGIALREEHGLDYVRAVGNLQNLVDAAGPNGSVAHHGVGHTRWATHGGVTEQNAHPLVGCDASKLAIVLNGIVENYRELRAQLTEEGHTFTSETDAEVVVHLLEQEYDGNLAEALTRVYPRLEGHFTIVAIHHDNPDLLAGVRQQTPLVVGLGDGENFLASNVAAFLSETRRAVFPADGEVVEITPGGARFFKDGVEVDHPAVEELDWDEDHAEKGGYETFMLKEIYEQPEAVRVTIGDRVRGHHLMLEALGLTELEVRNLRRIVIVAAGTSYHAGVVGRYIIEEWGRIPVEPDIASEWIYRNPVLSKDTLVIGISQSGESRDTVNAMKLARERGARTLAITNMMGTQITREVDATLYTRCGIEIGVAASKTFTAQVALLSLLALRLAEIRQTLPQEDIDFVIDRLHELPEKLEEFLDGDHPIDEIATTSVFPSITGRR